MDVSYTVPLRNLPAENDCNSAKSLYLYLILTASMESITSTLSRNYKP